MCGCLIVHRLIDGISMVGSMDMEFFETGSVAWMDSVYISLCSDMVWYLMTV